MSYVRYTETGSIYALVRVECINLKTFKKTCVIIVLRADMIVSRNDITYKFMVLLT